ncbi:hypothetical protein GCM10023196_105270 [Actinoallomurus vinaceus]|uniref:Uncharacterized protein n=1 Tax=Actinoallomurus vinaceus TaxID=1080074 RepID=A0ABP8UU74_9ACTN
MPWTTPHVTPDRLRMSDAASPRAISAAIEADLAHRLSGDRVRRLLGVRRNGAVRTPGLGRTRSVAQDSKVE